MLGDRLPTYGQFWPDELHSSLFDTLRENAALSGAPVELLTTAYLGLQTILTQFAYERSFEVRENWEGYASSLVKLTQSIENILPHIEFELESDTPRHDNAEWEQHCQSALLVLGALREDTDAQLNDLSNVSRRERKGKPAEKMLIRRLVWLFCCLTQSDLSFISISRSDGPRAKAMRFVENILVAVSSDQYLPDPVSIADHFNNPSRPTESEIAFDGMTFLKAKILSKMAV